MRRFLSVCVFAALAGCQNPPATYASPKVGYELRMPKGFVTPRERTEFRIASDVGPIDVAFDAFVFDGDGIFSHGEAYVACGLRLATAVAPFPLDDETLAKFDAAIGKAIIDVGDVTERRRIDGPGSVGEEIVVAGNGLKFSGRMLYVRIAVTRDAFYMLMAAADTSVAASRYGADKRAAFFDGFHLATEGAPARTVDEAAPRALDGATVAALTTRATKALFP